MEGMERTIDPDEKYGAFTMDEIYVMERTSVRSPTECLEFLDSFKGLDKLKKEECWLFGHDVESFSNPYPPDFVRKSLQFAFTTYVDELSKCEGVIIVPGSISREETENERIKIIQRDSLYIVTCEVMPSKWFILQNCRTAHYEHYTHWHLVFKESMQ
jgi:hypothetical protein